ncbi:MAG: hypothetical protein K6A95_06490 [Bacteroidales bacterium]|jgi:L-asparagine transporter-like permease|nr:hypothetical protein [Bacteroidales bacterium]
MKRVNYKVPKYVIQLLAFSIIVAILSVVLQAVWPAYTTPAMPFIILFFFFITLFTLYIVLRDQAQRDSRKFVSGYMLSRGIKFMSCLLFLLIYFFVNKPDRWRFAIAFIVIYFLFAVCEVFIMKRENARVQAAKDAAEKQNTDNGSGTTA